LSLQNLKSKKWRNKIPKQKQTCHFPENLIVEN